MTKPKSFTSIFIPSATVFIASFCIMVLELVASRLIARHLGSSLYTWTSVIGVILTGITIGNYLGGRIADKFSAKNSIAVLFAVCSIACVLTIILNNNVGKWMWLWHLSWPMRVFSHVSVVFLIPSALLGTISPVVAKMALDRGLSTGRTIGDIYAFSAAGSIAGTFVAGFFLIAAVGTISIIWVVGAVLLLLGIFYWCRLWILYVWAIIFTFLMILANVPASGEKSFASAIGLREKPNSKILYEDESRYCYISVRQDNENPNKLYFTQDKLLHSEILMDNILDLQYFYTKVYAAVTEGLSEKKEKLSIMAIGGGGYVFPRFIEKIWPASRIDVAEIDPDVTKAAKLAFGLQENTSINTINMDARNYVDYLLEQKRSGHQIPSYDYVYGDAFNDFSVPFQLVTKEFNEKIAEILNDNGIYMINLLDIFDSGLFLGSAVNTLEKTFPYVYVVTGTNTPKSFRNAFIIIASKQKLDLENIITGYKREKLKLWYLDDSDIVALKKKSKNLVLTDNFSPTDNLLVPVVQDNSRDTSSEKYLTLAKDLKKKGQFEKSIKYYLLAIKTYPMVSVQSYNDIGIIYDETGKLQQAVDAFNNAIQFSKEMEYHISIANIHYNLGTVLEKMGKTQQAAENYQNAVDIFQKNLIENPADHKTLRSMGDALATMGNFKAAADAFEKAFDLQPMDFVYYDNLVKALEYNGQYAKAIEITKKFIALMQSYHQDEAVLQLQEHLKYLENQNSQYKQSH